ncbi:hypothetical protein AVEN_123235-1, partial [Araneus ventricosus]
MAASVQNQCLNSNSDEKQRLVAVTFTSEAACLHDPKPQNNGPYAPFGFESIE